MHWGDGCLVPRSHYSTRPKSFGSRGPSESLKRIDRKGVGKRRTVTLTRSDIYTQHEGGALHLKSRWPPARAGSFSQINYLHTLFSIWGAVCI